MAAYLADNHYFAPDGSAPLDTNPTGTQAVPTVAKLADGGLVTAWLDGSTVVAQIYDPEGDKIGGELKVGTVGLLSSTNPISVVGLTGGGFTVAWDGTENLGLVPGIRAQVYTADGATVGNTIDVNQTTLGDQSNPSLTALANGGFGVGWVNTILVNSQADMRLYDASGAATTNEISLTTNTPFLPIPTLATLDDGNIVATWRDATSLLGRTGDIVGQIYKPDGTATGDSFSITGLATTAANYNPEVVSLANGGFAVAYVAYGTDPSTAGVHVQLYDADAHTVGQPLTVSTDIGALTTASITATDSGFLVSYAKAEPTGNLLAPIQYDVAAQLYDLSGKAVGSEFIVNDTTAGDQLHPAVASFGSGDLAAVYQTPGTGLLDVDVSGRLFYNVTTGTPGADTLMGDKATNVLIGSSGNDVLHGGGGSDVLDGGTGNDTATYDGLSHSYTIAMHDGSGAIAGGPEGGTDTLTSIENLTFADGTLTTDPNSDAAEVLRLYDTTVHRAPDGNGLDYWVGQMESGASLSTVANGIIASNEFQTETQGLSDSAYVNLLYQNALGRPADAAGTSYWLDQLAHGASRADILVSISDSDEHKADTAGAVANGLFVTDSSYKAVAALYDTFAGREPDANGLVYWADQIKSGALSLSDVANDFANSPEFQSDIAGKSSAAVVEYLYENALDRHGEPSGIAYWTDQIAHGLTTGQLLLDFSQSAEHYNLIASHISNGIDYIA